MGEVSAQARGHAFIFAFSLCAQGTHNFSHMDHLIINYIPGVWGRIFHALTTRTRAEVINLVEYKQVDLHKLFSRLWTAQRNKCGVCLRQAGTWHLNHLLIKICSACCKDKSKFITKTEAKKTYFLSTDEEFDSLFCFISHNRRYVFAPAELVLIKKGTTLLKT